MRIIEDKHLTSIDHAVGLVLIEAGQEDMSKEACSLFVTSLDVMKLRSEGEKILRSAVHQKYGSKTRWCPATQGPWLVPSPRLRYDTLPIPMLSFSLQPYLVAGFTILSAGYSPSNTLVSLIGKPEKLMLPMIFLQALLNEDIENFTLVSKDGTHTSRIVPGLKEPLILPDEFVAELTWILERKSVVSWLLGFGAQGRSLAPQVAGTLLGFQFRGKPENIPPMSQAWSQELILEGLTNMFGAQRAKDMFNKRLPLLKPNMANEEALRLILQMED